MTGLLEPDAARDQPQGAPRARWRTAALTTADFAGSVLLGAAVIMGVVWLTALLVAFVTWEAPHAPAGWSMRAAVVASTVLEIWHRWRKARGK